MNNEYWGYHLILDVADCDQDFITNPDQLSAWVKELVQDIKMVAYGEPQILHFGHNADHLEGWTVLQLIETSNITAHFCDNTREGYIDIFSCMPFDEYTALENVQKWTKTNQIKHTMLKRKATSWNK